MLLEQMKMFFILIAAGMTFQRLGLVSDENIDGFALVNIRVITPVMLITVISKGSREDMSNMLPFLICGLSAMLISLGIAYISGKAFRIAQPTRNIHTAVAGLGNGAMVGYPLLLSIFPEKAHLAIAVYAIVDAFIVWTAVPILADPKGRVNLRKLINPITVSAFIGLAMMLMNIRPKNIAWDTLTEFGGTVKYASLLYIGMDIGRKGIKRIFGRPIVLSVIPVRLILTPAVIFLIIGAVNVLSREFMMMLLVLSMTPSVMCITMVARTMGSDDDYATGAMISTTITSLLTIPLMMRFIGL